MSTTDKNLTESTSTSTSESQEDDDEDDETMGTIPEETTATSIAAKFGGGSKDADDWGEFAEEEEDNKPVVPNKVEDKPKYTFGASSGFGTKGWVASHQSIPTPSKVSICF
jgi:Ran-binding protein 3